MADETAAPLKYAHVLGAFYGSPWAILPAKLAEIQQFLHFAAAGGTVPPEEVQGRLGRKPERAAQPGRVGVIQIFGTIAQRFGMLDGSGGTSTEMICEAMDALLADRTCKAIVLQIDSPGGSVYGVREVADKIFNARAEKKIVAVADSLAASAAYWIGSQADEFCCTPSGQVGSIGCISAHDDYSKMLETAGVKTTLISAGKYKAEGNPYQALDDDARAAMQKCVDDYYSAFVKAVARGRGVTEAAVRNGFGQGRLQTADDAKASGMIDRVSTLEQCLRRLEPKESASAETFQPSVDALRRRLALEEAD
jgi:capsid assembly protease